MGYKVLVLEGRGRPGGRVYTKRLEVSPVCSCARVAHTDLSKACNMKVCNAYLQLRLGSNPSRTDHLSDPLR